MKIGILVLAGGKGRRMNFKEKWSLKLKNKTFLETIIENFKGNEIYVVSKADRNLNLRNVNVIYDEYLEESAAIFGIAAAFQKSNIDIFFILGCDMPFMSKEVYTRMLSELKNFYGVVLEKNKKIYPLGAIYTRELLPVIENAILKKEYSLKKILSSPLVRKIDLDINMKNFININTLEEYQRYIVEGENNEI